MITCRLKCEEPEVIDSLFEMLIQHGEP